MAIRDTWKTFFRRNETTKSKPVGNEIGASGSKIFAGLPMEEYNNDLAFPASVKVYDRMRRSDGQIAAVLAAMTLPIRCTKWYMEPDNDADDKDLAEDIADFVSDNLFGGMEYSWDDHLREALLMLVFGFSVFEKVYKYDTWNGRPVIVLDKYAPRVAPSIWRFPQDPKTSKIVAVQQINYMTGEIKDIPIEKCRVYTFQREGDNIVGISALRPAYKHWYIKDALYSIMAVGLEQSLVGVPYAKLPTGTSEDEKDRILGILNNVRTSDASGFTIPDDVVVEILEGKRNAIDALPFIEHHDTMIARSVLAQFINLGTLSSASGGSYALGNTMVDMFVLGLESIANYIQGEVQKDVEELVAWNFGPDAPVPQLKHKNISFSDMSQVAQALYWLGAGHLVTTDESMEDYIRDLFGIPPIPREAMDSKLMLPQDRYNPDIVPDDTLNPAEIAAIKQRQTQASGRQTSDGSSDGGSQTQAAQSANRAAMSDPTTGASFDDGTDSPAATPKWRRNLTTYERVVQFEDLQKQWTTFEDKFVTNLKGVLQQSADQIIGQIDKILSSGNTIAQKIGAINALTAPLTSKYKDVIQAEIQSAYQYGVQSVSQELGVNPQDITTPLADVSAIKAKAETLAEQQLTGLLSTLKLAAISQVQRDVPKKQVLYGLKATADAKVNGPDLKTSGNVTVAESINIGRGSAAKKIGIQGAQWSAVLDSRTCPLCEEVDGKVISVDNPDFDMFRPPLHPGCRCILVYILEDEEDVEFDWTTPAHSLVKRYGYLVNH